MPIKSKWILTLGILAMSPGLAAAKGPLGLPGLTKSPAETKTPSSQETTNQSVANEIAAALRAARLTGYDINIEYQDGTAVLTGMIQDAQQKATADQLTRKVAGVKSVDNRLGLITPEPAQAIQQTAFEAPLQSQGAVSRADFQASDAQPVVSPIQQTAATQNTAAKAKNQQTANSVAKALKESGMSGYDIEISVKSGVASLSGQVGSPEQVQRITQVVSQVPGVQSVNNQLQAGVPVTQAAAFQPNPNGGEAPPPGGGYVPGMEYGVPGGGPGHGMYPPMPMPPGPVYGHAGPGPVSPVYNQPYLPEHSWPTYAPYPNSAAVTYPTQYSASAFPYIGPFYPYPQVPLGWRKSTLEWDDGQWQLKFSPKTDRWWWFVNPKNWD